MSNNVLLKITLKFGVRARWVLCIRQIVSTLCYIPFSFWNLVFCAPLFLPFPPFRLLIWSTPFSPFFLFDPLFERILSPLCYFAPIFLTFCLILPLTWGREVYCHSPIVPATGEKKPCCHQNPIPNIQTHNTRYMAESSHEFDTNFNNHLLETSNSEPRNTKRPIHDDMKKIKH